MESTSLGPLCHIQMLEPYYKDLLSQLFPTSALAVDYCRNLSAQYGFTIKQEQSNSKSIYVYCSREGLADSSRSRQQNKSSRKSKRCDCLWRVVLRRVHERTWQFHISQNPETRVHNHAPIPLGNMDVIWPKTMQVMIQQLAQQGLPTSTIRTQVQQAFPDIPWHERRFYNRIAQERQKQRQSETRERIEQLHKMWSTLCTMTAGSEDLTVLIQQRLRQWICQVATWTSTDVDALPAFFFTDPQDDKHRDAHRYAAISTSLSESPPSIAAMTHSASSSSASFQEQDEYVDFQSAMAHELLFPDTNRLPFTQQLPKTPQGFAMFELPRQLFYVKVYSQRNLQSILQAMNKNQGPDGLDDELAPMSWTSPPTTEKKAKNPVVFTQLHEPMILDLSDNTEMSYARSAHASSMPPPPLPPPPPSAHAPSYYNPTTMVHPPMPPPAMPPQSMLTFPPPPLPPPPNAQAAQWPAYLPQSMAAPSPSTMAPHTPIPAPQQHPQYYPPVAVNTPVTPGAIVPSQREPPY
ncbi:hypothetical protein BC940DRAFT_337107 [Gongronella butleri]|nr:hypothetical protein BC940DRAFT_337107 [Gongronella butleri]